MGAILENIIWTNFLIVLIVLLKKTIGQNFGVLWRKIIWFLIAIRLLIPVSMDYFPIYKIKVSTGLSYIGAMRKGIFPSHRMPNGQYTMASNGMFFYMPILYYVVLISVVISIILIIKHHEEYGFAINKLRQSLKETEFIVGEMKVYETEMIETPMILDYQKPCLLLPKGIEKKNLKYIFSHEYAHFKMKDLWYKRLLLLVNDLYWFNPFMYLMRKNAYEDVELFCDTIAVNGYTNQEKQQYCEALLEMAVNKKNAFSLEFSERTEKIKVRIDNIFMKRQEKIGYIIIFIALAVMVLLENNMEILVINPSINGEYEINETKIKDAMYVCEKILNDLGEYGTVKITYEYQLDGPAYSKKELSDNLKIYIQSSEYENMNDLIRDSIGAFANSYFGWSLNQIVVSGE